MALLWMDGFDHYTDQTNVRLSSLFPQLWIDETASGGASGQLKTMPVLGGWALHARLQVPGNSNYAMARCRLPRTPVSGETWIVGTHVWIESLAPYRGNCGIIGFGSSSGAAHLTVGISSEGLLRYHVGSPSATANNSTFTFTVETLYHVEMKTYFHASAGYVEIRVDGALVFSLTSINTLGSFAHTHLLFSPFQAGSGGSTDTEGFRYKNVFILDDSGDSANDWLGPCRVALALPSEDKSPQDWVLSTGSYAYDLLNNVPPLPDTQYVRSDEVGDESLFGFNPISGLSGVVGVQLGLKGRSSNIVSVVPEINGDSLGNMGPTHDYKVKTYSQNPVGPAPWTPSSANGLEALIRRSF